MTPEARLDQLKARLEAEMERTQRGDKILASVLGVMSAAVLGVWLGLGSDSGSGMHSAKYYGSEGSQWSTLRFAVAFCVTLVPAVPFIFRFRRGRRRRKFWSG